MKKFVVDYKTTLFVFLLKYLNHYQNSRCAKMYTKNLTQFEKTNDAVAFSTIEISRNESHLHEKNFFLSSEIYAYAES